MTITQGMLRTIVFSLVLLSSYAAGQRPSTNSSRTLIFTINKTWNGRPLLRNETVKIVLNGDGDSNGIIMKIEAPFYNDSAPKGPPGEPFLNLWDYEVVEAFFLNDEQQYLEVEVGPHGQHIVLIFNGRRNLIRHSLPLNVTTKLRGSRWIGEAVIPSHYFPPQVKKFNAHAINGVGEKRRYLALYPTDGSTTDPDFHNLDFFRPIKMDQLVDLSNQRSCRMHHPKDEPETIASQKEENDSQNKAILSPHQSEVTTPSREGSDSPPVINHNSLLPSLFCIIEDVKNTTLPVSGKNSDLSKQEDSTSTSDTPHTTSQRPNETTSTQDSENRHTQNV